MDNQRKMMNLKFRFAGSIYQDDFFQNHLDNDLKKELIIFIAFILKDAKNNLIYINEKGDFVLISELKDINIFYQNYIIDHYYWVDNKEYKSEYLEYDNFRCKYISKYYSVENDQIKFVNPFNQKIQSFIIKKNESIILSVDSNDVYSYVNIVDSFGKL